MTIQQNTFPMEVYRHPHPTHPTTRRFSCIPNLIHLAPAALPMGGGSHPGHAAAPTGYISGPPRHHAASPEPPKVPVAASGWRRVVGFVGFPGEFFLRIQFPDGGRQKSQGWVGRRNSGKLGNWKTARWTVTIVVSMQKTYR